MILKSMSMMRVTKKRWERRRRARRMRKWRQNERRLRVRRPEKMRSYDNLDSRNFRPILGPDRYELFRE